MTDPLVEDQAMAHEQSQPDAPPMEVEASTQEESIAKPVKRPPRAVDEPGKSILPAARVSRIIKADRDIEILSKDAIFLISVAAEHFIKKLTEAAYFNARQGQRKGVQYRDLASAIQNDETYFYLQEVIPPPMPLADAMKKRKKKLATDNGTLTDDEDGAEESADKSQQTQPPSLAPVFHPTLPPQGSSATSAGDGQPGSASPEVSRSNGHHHHTRSMQIQEPQTFSDQSMLESLPQQPPTAPASRDMEDL